MRVVDGRRFEPTPLGSALIEGLRRVDPEMVEPKIRAHVEVIYVVYSDVMTN